MIIPESVRASIYKGRTRPARPGPARRWCAPAVSQQGQPQPELSPGPAPQTASAREQGALRPWPCFARSVSDLLHRRFGGSRGHLPPCRHSPATWTRGRIPAATSSPQRSWRDVSLTRLQKPTSLRSIMRAGSDLFQ